MNKQEKLLEIAKQTLYLETLETREKDSLDFSTQAVWNIKRALEQAYEAGAASVEKPKCSNVCSIKKKTEPTETKVVEGSITYSVEAWQYGLDPKKTYDP